MPHCGGEGTRVAENLGNGLIRPVPRCGNNLTRATSTQWEGVHPGFDLVSFGLDDAAPPVSARAHLNAQALLCLSGNTM